jgi:hypothetical protein
VLIFRGGRGGKCQSERECEGWKGVSKDPGAKDGDVSVCNIITNGSLSPEAASSFTQARRLISPLVILPSSILHE